MRKNILTIDRLRRVLFSYAHDVAMSAISFIVALYLRLGSDIISWPRETIFSGITIFTIVSAVVFFWMRLDRIIWRYASIGDLGRIFRAVILTVIVFVACQFIYNRLDELPRSFLFIQIFVLTVMIAAPRFVYRFCKDGELSVLLEKNGHKRTPVLLIGAGDGTDVFIREMTRGNQIPYRVVGIIDEEGGRIGRNIRGVPILGNIDEISRVFKDLCNRGIGPQRIVITNSKIKGEAVRQVTSAAEEIGVPVSRVPDLTELGKIVTDSNSFSIKPIEVEDVLGRPQKILDMTNVEALFNGSKVLITGAGGTIGSELARQIVSLEPSEIIILDNSEFLIYQIELTLSELYPHVKPQVILGDVRDEVKIQKVMNEFSPDIVIHSAALKHVPLVESNPIEGINTNVIGTWNVARAALKNSVKTMVLISTDKAVDPTNIMGATKRAAESICQSFDTAEKHKTRFLTVRFGNVLGSTGSVIPLFERQIAAGGPVTVTHPEMTRYFMTVREAVSLVLQAAALPKSQNSSEKGGISVLEMGQPLKILDLAEQLIRLSGLKPHEDIKIDFTGIRSGEKLHEELFHPEEPLTPTSVTGINAASPRFQEMTTLEAELRQLKEAVYADDKKTSIGFLKKIIPEFKSENY